VKSLQLFLLFQVLPTVPTVLTILAMILVGLNVAVTIQLNVQKNNHLVRLHARLLVSRKAFGFATCDGDTDDDDYASFALVNI
jgi:hypothetical protein